MPYIMQETRNKLEAGVIRPRSPGDLNYMFSKIINHYLLDNGLNYGTINDILGALEGAKLEFFRRIVSKYEEERITSQGDVYSIEKLF